MVFRSYVKLKLCILLLAPVMLGLLGVVLARVPEPGSKEDPLVTKTYVDWHARWKKIKVKGGDFFKLDGGTELIITEPMDHPIRLREHNFQDTRFVDVTSGVIVLEYELQPFHLYVVASDEQARIAFEESATIYVRGLKP